MKSNCKTKQLLALLFCVVMIAGVLTQTAAASVTGRCTNIINEGIEHFFPITVYSTDANEWRIILETDVINRADGSSAGFVRAMEIEVVNSTTRYQCTEIDPSLHTFSCNSIPTNAIISGVYVLYAPDGMITEDANIQFEVKQAASQKVLLNGYDTVKYPNSPCSRNTMTKDFVAPADSKLVYNTSADCPSEHKTIFFTEASKEYALVNINVGSALDFSRMQVDVSPDATFSYTLVLTFEDFDGAAYDVEYQYNEVTRTGTPIPPTGTLANAKLPLVLTGGRIENISTTKTDLWGQEDYPSNFDFNIRFWYENNAGAPGYENSLFHFERNMVIQFAPYCDHDATTTMVPTGIASALYDPCQTRMQLFNVSLTGVDGSGIRVYDDQSDCDTVEYCNSVYSVNPKITDYAVNHQVPKGSRYYFETRKCLDSHCSTYTTTDAYPYSITVSDGLNMSTTYRSEVSTHTGRTSSFVMKLFRDSSNGREFAITGTRFMAEGPGTYMVLGFLDINDIHKNDLEHYAVKFYVTVNKTDQKTSCSTLANNGYYRAYWNDCLSHLETQLMTFEHIPDKEIGWINNRSASGVHFPYVSELSYLPQKLQIASLNCSFTALTTDGDPASGYCNPDDIYVPRYTRVTINGGTFYLEQRPSSDEYRVAYAREETMNISHLFFTIPIKTCENVRRIPDTGISLRSPLKVQESVDAATSFVFTGNSLRIPAIGLGMETPIPIVHVYYEEGSENLQWDLSTLGNYVGELEGGAYLPYAGNAALTGHYWSGGVFKNLEHLNYEDEIIVYGNDGIKYTYKVVQKFLAQPTDVYEMFQQIGERSLTLVTCENYNMVTDEYERRQLIRASIVSEEPYVTDW